MKKYLLAIIAAIVLVSCGAPDSYKISGNLQGVEDGTMVTLITIEGAGTNALDSTFVRNGKFVFKGETDTCHLALVVFDVDGDMAGCQFFLERGKISLVYNSATSLQVVSGSVCNDAFQKFYDEALVLDDKVNELQDKLQVAIAANEDGHSFVNELNDLQNQFRQMVAKSISDNPDNLFGFQQLQQYFEFFEPDEDLEFMKAYEPVFGNDLAFKNMTAILARQLPSTVGQKFIDFTARLLDKRYKFSAEASLAEYVNASKLVYLNFWASYMPPCIDEIPDLKAALDAYRSKGFQIVSVSVDEDTQEWTQAIQEYEMTWPQLWNGLDDFENSAAMKYAISAVPMSFLIDSEGTIIGRNIQAEELEDILADYFK